MKRGPAIEYIANELAKWYSQGASRPSGILGIIEPYPSRDEFHDAATELLNSICR